MNWYKIAQEYNPMYISGWILPDNTFMNARGISHASCIKNSPNSFNISSKELNTTLKNYPSEPERFLGLAYSKGALRIMIVPDGDILAYGLKQYLNQKITPTTELARKYNAKSIHGKECDIKGNVIGSNEILIKQMVEEY